ncbi:MOSC-domain-containing protein [Ascodesmis nigricans]|uniref:MOSC-domain-containing protein n=1 Tax=Ascodesmis nigricans TaxID=341454 RepID=A0A4S2N0B1_9PEZI|nr:MOSC-domain-containing protein [Ascodesmis nigricans]
MDKPASNKLLSAPVLGTSAVIFAGLAYYLYTLRNNQSNVIGVKRSHLADEFEYTPKEIKSDWKVKSLWIYPLKSARGIEIDQIDVQKTGFQYDRQFMLAEWQQDAKTGESGWLLVDSASPTGGCLRLSFPSSRWRKVSFDVPLSTTFPGFESLPLVSATIWKDKPLSHDLGSLFPKELEQLGLFLGAKGCVTMMRASDTHLREVYRCAPRKEDLGYQSVVGFADAYPLHILNIASIRELNERVATAIPKLSVRRFRANIIVEGPDAYNEDDWKVLEIGSHKYHASCRTVRCKLPNVDPETGIRNPNEPDVTMRKYRTIDPGHKTGACMGLQMVPFDTQGIIKVGDKVTVLERGEHCYISQ